MIDDNGHELFAHSGELLQGLCRICKGGWIKQWIGHDAIKI